MQQSHHSKTTIPPAVMHRSVDRLVFFSDAVFAIAITLLALEIHLPASTDLQSASSVAHALSEASSQFIAFGLSFMIIGFFWMSHVRKYRALASHDARFMLLNLIILMLIGLMPFATNLMSSSSAQIATQLYAGILAALGLLSAYTWRYALARGFIAPLPPKKLQRNELIQPLIVAGVFAVSIVVASINADAAKWLWLTLALIGWLMR